MKNFYLFVSLLSGFVISNSVLAAAWAIQSKINIFYVKEKTTVYEGGSVLIKMENMEVNNGCTSGPASYYLLENEPDDNAVNENFHEMFSMLLSAYSSGDIVRLRLDGCGGSGDSMPKIKFGYIKK